MAESKENAAALQRMRDETEARLRDLQRKGQANTAEHRQLAERLCRIVAR